MEDGGNIINSYKTHTHKNTEPYKKGKRSFVFEAIEH